MSWPIAKVGDICTFVYGKGLAQAIRDGGVNDVFGSNGVVGNHSKCITHGETIVIGRKGSIGEVNWSSNSCWPIDTTYYIDKNSTNQNLRWLYWRLRKLGLVNMNKSAAIPGLNREDVYRIKIELPPLAEQERIASILDKTELVKRNRELAAEKLGTLRKEIFTNMFSDLLEKPNTTLGSAFDVRDGTHDSPKGQSEGYPLITSKNLNNNTINLEDVSFINLEDFEAINRRSKVDYCDILMPMIGTIGNPIIVHDKNPQFAIKNVALIKTGNMEASFYVEGLLETQYFERYVTKESKGGTQKFLSLGNIRNFPIHVPSDEQLQKFSKISKALIQVQSSLVKSQCKLDELLSSLQFTFMTRN